VARAALARRRRRVVFMVWLRGRIEIDAAS